jgi:hypothetical protein
MRNSRLIAISVAAAGLAALSLVAATSSPAPNNLELIAGVMQAVERDYVHPVGPDLLTKDALKGMLTRLDPHSDYMDEQEYRQSQADIGGKFGGIGVEISTQGGVPKVIAPIDGAPAAQAGIGRRGRRAGSLALRPQQPRLAAIDRDVPRCRYGACRSGSSLRPTASTGSARRRSGEW